jgi:uncharacterized protein DUF4397
MSRLLKVLSFALVVVALGAFAASCGNGNAQYRVVNAIPNTTTFDSAGFAVYMNGAAVFSNVTFPGVFPNSNGKYQSVSNSSNTLALYTQSEAGQVGATPLISSALNLGGGTQYTIVLAGNSTASGATYPLAAQVITDPIPTATFPASGDAGVRIIDTSLTLGAVDVFDLPPSFTCDVSTPCPSNAKIASGLVYGANGSSGNINSGYQNVGLTNGQVAIWVTASGNGAEAILHGTYTLNALQNYTLVLADGGSPEQFVFMTP